MPTGYAESYNETQYPGFAYRGTRPDRLELAGRLFGLDPTPHARARVLEIGCATGSNLLPMAELYPDARFVGIDIAPAQIDVARATAAELGLTNVDLQAIDLRDVPERVGGSFDYVIAHGVFSWVPAAVQDALLELCRGMLSPHGIAYISHNTKPGWHARGMAGEIMRFHVRQVREPAERARQGKAALDFIIRGATPSEKTYRATLAEHLALIADKPEWALLHDELSEPNDACYIYELAERLAGHELTWLADSDVPSMIPVGIAPEVLQALDRADLGVIEREQYHDLLRNRAFRMSLVCRAGLPIDHHPDQKKLLPFHVLSPADAVGDPAAPGATEFRTASTKVSIAEPRVKQALARLIAEWPRSLPLPALAAELGRAAEAEELAAELLVLFAWHMVELSAYPELAAARAPERPRATAYARLAARRDAALVNLRHERVLADAAQRRILPLLDGTRTLAELGDGAAAALDALVRNAMILA
jgi:SAM-dependent methyltransferase